MRSVLVLKLSPKSFYDFFEKTSFQEEAEMHNTLCKSAEHIVKINDAFEAVVKFTDSGTTIIDCNVMVLEYVNGSPLSHYLEGNKGKLSTATICQIAIDLLLMRKEFEACNFNHNDLHAGNIIVEELDSGHIRANALDGTIRLKAIDLGSVSDKSKSSNFREGDVKLIAQHVNSLLQLHLSKPQDLDERDFRTALALQGIIEGLVSNQGFMRNPNWIDLVNKITEAYDRSSQSWKPWQVSLVLKRFDDHYNAQTLESWHVPDLLIDPDGNWIKEISKPGPQIITGMRGCGKTMVLRSLDIHARAPRRSSESDQDRVDRILGDGFIGLFVRAQRLLELHNDPNSSEEDNIKKLFINYALEAARAILHLSDFMANSLNPRSHIYLFEAVRDCIEGIEPTKFVSSLDELEVFLEKLLVLSTRVGNTLKMVQAPEAAFIRLSEQIKKCSNHFVSFRILYLLDDVSTRYLDISQIKNLISVLLFQNSICAFKFSSEGQTINLGLYSPGRNHPARIGRDLSVFDLGEEVFRLVSSKTTGKKFILDILDNRTKRNSTKSMLASPKVLLGDVPLEDIALEISSSSNTSSIRKNVYRGLSCLSNVCVGDIGDVIKLYDDMLQQMPSDFMQQIPQEIQSNCFQNLSSKRLFDLNRRDSRFKDYALAFSQAAHELLTRSFKNKKGEKKPRIRQYSSIYIRVTTKDDETSKKQIEALRDLIDAGVFVYSSGNGPRTKTKDSDPIQQFKLSFRKIYGLASYIGLADRDRFELSGDELARWLQSPAEAKDILLRNQIKKEVEDNEAYQDESVPSKIEFASALNAITSEILEAVPAQRTLFDSIIDNNPQPSTDLLPKKIDISIEKITDYSTLNSIDSVFTGLGFEERTIASNKFLSSTTIPKQLVAVQYSEPGNSTIIEGFWNHLAFPIQKINYAPECITEVNLDGVSMIDITGLAKPLIFTSIRHELLTKRVVYLCYTPATVHYPLQSDIDKLMIEQSGSDPTLIFEGMTSLLKGEDGPYTLCSLLDEDIDPSRNRFLFAFASAKHERIFSLLDNREYDALEIIAPTGDTPRSKLALIAANYLVENYPNGILSTFDTNNLEGLLEHLDERYLHDYSILGANIEIGLTGSKIQAVAAAILSARRKISQAWYVSPHKFDPNRFTSGVGDTVIFKITVQ